MASPAGPPGGHDNSAASFLGALISLTSHSNIRYQGILSNIDAAHATLSLEKGTSTLVNTQCNLGVQRADAQLWETRKMRFPRQTMYMTILYSAPLTWLISALMIRLLRMTW